MLSKGAALVYGHGIDSRYRPMFDIDVFVDPAELTEARAVLAGHGFSSPFDSVFERHQAALVRDSHGVGFSAQGGAQIDLHWHLMHTARNTALDRLLHDAAVECDLGGVSCHATSLEDTLVLSVAHGMRWARGSAVRWVGDVALIQRDHGGDLDWGLVVHRARQARISRTVLDALDYVAGLTSIEVPAGARRALRRAPIPVALRLRRMRRDDARDGGPRPPGRVVRLADAYEEEVAGTVAPGARTGPVDVARFLARRWGLAGVSGVPRHAAWVAAGRPWRIRALARRGLGRDAVGWLAGWPHYELGTELRFDPLGEGYARLGPGWWYPEPHGVWSRTPCARIVLPLQHPVPDELQLEAYLHAPIADRNRDVSVRVIIGDTPVAHWRFSSRRSGGHVQASVPSTALTKEAVAVVTLLVEPTMAPADTRLNSDLRQLGIGVSSLRLAAAPTQQLPPPAPRVV
jgi:hypothetical protein